MPNDENNLMTGQSQNPQTNANVSENQDIAGNQINQNVGNADDFDFSFRDSGNASPSVNFDQDVNQQRNGMFFSPSENKETAQTNNLDTAQSQTRTGMFKSVDELSTSQNLGGTLPNQDQNVENNEVNNHNISDEDSYFASIDPNDVEEDKNSMQISFDVENKATENESEKLDQEIENLISFDNEKQPSTKAQSVNLGGTRVDDFIIKDIEPNKDDNPVPNNETVVNTVEGTNDTKISQESNSDDWLLQEDKKVEETFGNAQADKMTDNLDVNVSPDAVGQNVENLIANEPNDIDNTVGNVNLQGENDLHIENMGSDVVANSQGDLVSDTGGLDSANGNYIPNENEFAKMSDLLNSASTGPVNLNNLDSQKNFVNMDTKNSVGNVEQQIVQPAQEQGTVDLASMMQNNENMQIDQNAQVNQGGQENVSEDISENVSVNMPETVQPEIAIPVENTAETPVDAPVEIPVENSVETPIESTEETLANGSYMDTASVALDSINEIGNSIGENENMNQQTVQPEQQENPNIQNNATDGGLVGYTNENNVNLDNIQGGISLDDILEQDIQNIDSQIDSQIQGNISNGAVQAQNGNMQTTNVKKHKKQSGLVVIGAFVGVCLLIFVAMKMFPNELNLFKKDAPIVNIPNENMGNNDIDNNVVENISNTGEDMASGDTVNGDMIEEIGDNLGIQDDQNGEYLDPNSLAGLLEQNENNDYIDENSNMENMDGQFVENDYLNTTGLNDTGEQPFDPFADMNNLLNKDQESIDKLNNYMSQGQYYNERGIANGNNVVAKYGEYIVVTSQEEIGKLEKGEEIDITIFDRFDDLINKMSSLVG